MLEGFGIVGLVILLGVVLAHVGFLDGAAGQVLTKVAFWVATPAMLIGIVADADLATLLSTTVAALAAGVAIVGLIAVLIWRFVFRADAAGATIGFAASTYANTVYLGVPISLYALDDPTASIPLLLLQTIVIQPLMLMVLDRSTARAAGRGRGILGVLRPLANPLVLGTGVGLVLALTGVEVPSLLGEPLAMLGEMSVPLMLLAYGVSLRRGARPGVDGGWGPILTASILKLLVLPAVVALVGAFVFSVEGHALLSVAVVSSLPVAQNIFALAAAYRIAVPLARDAILVTTLGSPLAVLGLAAVLG